TPFLRRPSATCYSTKYRSCCAPVSRASRSTAHRQSVHSRRLRFPLYRACIRPVQRAQPTDDNRAPLPGVPQTTARYEQFAEPYKSSHMNFQQLRIIRETVRQNFNLTEVAGALYTSQSGVSKHIRDLEGELGVELFIRRGKRLLGLT